MPQKYTLQDHKLLLKPFFVKYILKWLIIEFTIEMLIESDKSFQQIICILLLDKNLDETLMWAFFLQKSI